MSFAQDLVGTFGRKLIAPLCRLVGSLADRSARFRESSPTWPPLFVVGAPRSGTTAAYLHIVNQYRVSYLPNVVDSFPACPLMAARLARVLARPYEPTYESRFGIVEGTLAPGDGWEVFHRWFPRYRHDLGVDPAGESELPSLIARIERWTDAPFVNKNNNHCTRIPELAAWCPNSAFIHVRRDLAATAASLLEGRRAHGVGLNEPWSVQPRRCVGRTFDDELHQVVFTILEARAEVRRALEALDDDRWHQVDYVAFCRDPTGLEGWLEARRTDGRPVYRRRDEPPDADLSVSDRTVPEDFRETVRRLDRRWRNEQDV